MKAAKTFSPQLSLLIFRSWAVQSEKPDRRSSCTTFICGSFSGDLWHRDKSDETRPEALIFALRSALVLG